MPAWSPPTRPLPRPPAAPPQVVNTQQPKQSNAVLIGIVVLFVLWLGLACVGLFLYMNAYMF